MLFLKGSYPIPPPPPTIWTRFGASLYSRHSSYHNLFVISGSSPGEYSGKSIPTYWVGDWFRFPHREATHTVIKNLPANAGVARDLGSTPASGRSLGEGNSNLLHYSCLENSMNRGAWWTTAHGVAKSAT